MADAPKNDPMQMVAELEMEMMSDMYKVSSFRIIIKVSANCRHIVSNNSKTWKNLIVVVLKKILLQFLRLFLKCLKLTHYIVIYTQC